MADSNLKVWWIPQLGMDAVFEVSVSSIEEGVKVMDVLADYDLFQFENNVKPDYCNTGGLLMKDESGEWVDWCDLDTFEDDPRRYLEDRDAA